MSTIPVLAIFNTANYALHESERMSSSNPYGATTNCSVVNE
jgi:hypothetical protein